MPQDLVPYRPRRIIDADRQIQPVKLSTVLANMGVSGPRVPSADLIDREFVITHAASFPSAYEKQDHAFFCVVIPIDTGEMLTTVIGGQACVDILDVWAGSGRKEPLQVTLRFHEGKGSFAGYYTFE